MADAGAQPPRFVGRSRRFCGGYDFGGGFEHCGEMMETDDGIAQVHGWCVGGGSDFALCADLVIASEGAVIGTPYSRMWGSYLSGMWI